MIDKGLDIYASTILKLKTSLCVRYSTNNPFKN